MTITHRRTAHLRRQRLGLAQDPPDLHVIVGMGERPDIPAGDGAPDPIMLEIGTTDRGLPLAAARNLGAETAVRAGAQVLIFLDVDCIPGPEMVSTYRKAALATAPPALLCGPVAYLPPPPVDGYPTSELADLAPLHPGRPSPAPGTVAAGTQFELFWSLSFCVSTASWSRLSGFHVGYVGYGGEDTDFAFSAKAKGASLLWVGGADAYHQHHPPSRQNSAHIPELVRNARLFYARQGWWPMRKWLDELASRQLIDFDPEMGRLTLNPSRSMDRGN